jgi:hypothetical protein
MASHTFVWILFADRSATDAQPLLRATKSEIDMKTQWTRTWRGGICAMAISAVGMTITTSCNKEAEQTMFDPGSTSSGSMKALPASTPSPFTLTGGTYYKDINYSASGTTMGMTFDLFIPTTASTLNPAALVVFAHGGGFVSGDKADAWTGPTTYKTDIQYYMNNNIAFASINYRFKTDAAFTPPGGYSAGQAEEYRILKCMNDAKRCLQFIRYNALDYTINKARVGMFGGSAGGGMTLWLGYKADQADASAADPVLRESTKLCGLGHINSQASYSPTYLVTVFPECTNIPNPSYTSAPLHFLGFMNAGDPETYIVQKNQHNCSGAGEASGWQHSPRMAQKLVERAAQAGVNVPTKAQIDYATPSAINTLGGELLYQFMKRKLVTESC